MHDPSEAVIGRELETRTIDELLAMVRSGRPEQLILRGPPGIGKTHLLRYARRRSNDMLQLNATGVESELRLPYAGLHQLLRPISEQLADAGEPQLRSLRDALGLHLGVRPNHLAVASGTLTLLAQVAATRPVLCVIDDAQWLDSLSLEVIGFVARRLFLEPVGVLLAMRDDPAGRETVTGLRTLEVVGLSAHDGTALVTAHAPRSVAAPVAKALVAGTGGNPLALIELAGHLPPDALDGSQALPEPLPLVGELQGLFSLRIGESGEALRMALVVAAAARSPDPTLLWRALDALGHDRGDADLVRLEEFLLLSVEVSFRHPLMRSGAYWGASPEQRRRAHAALAAVSDPVLEADERLWHLATASIGPDGALADELEAAARGSAARQEWVNAAVLLERSVELSPTPASRGPRTIAAATARLQAGDLTAARQLLARAGPLLARGRDAAEARRTSGHIFIAEGNPAAAVDALAEAAEMYAGEDRHRARTALFEAFDAGHLAGRFSVGHDASTILRRHGELSEGDEDSLSPGDQLMSGFAAGGSDRGTGVQRLTNAIACVQQEPDRGIALRHLPLAWVAAVETWNDTAGDALSARWLRYVRAEGNPSSLILAQSRIPYLLILFGRLGRAEELLWEARSLANAVGDGAMLGPYATAEMYLWAWQGRKAVTRERGQSLTAALTRANNELGVRQVYSVMAVLELGLGNYPAALQAAQRGRDPGGLIHLNLDPELAEAAVRSGQHSVAEAARERLARQAGAAGTSWANGMLARVDALLSGDLEAEAHYRDSIDRLGESRLRSQLARSHLLYGEWLRRRRRRREAREQLRLAVEMLTTIGAHGFADRAQRELAATGERVRTGAAAALHLTPQERRIAHLAQNGASNKEIAGQLYVSPATVAYHLAKVFRKLGIENRVGLSEALAHGVPPVMDVG